MAEMGKWQKAVAKRQIEQGMVFALDTLEVLMPRKYVPVDLVPGGELEVFLYRDSEDRPTVVPFKPQAELDEFAFVKIQEITSHGAFAQWGLPKDLLIPYSEMEKPLKPGDQVLVKIHLDPKTDRLYGSPRSVKFLRRDMDLLKEGQMGEALVYAVHPLGFSAVFNQEWAGLFYTNELTKPLILGEKTTCYIKKIREDGKLDLSLSPVGFPLRNQEARKVVLDALNRLGGYLNLTDSSDPEEIRQRLGISKKAFKEALGGLYRERLISLEPQGIRLNPQEK